MTFSRGVTTLELVLVMGVLVIIFSMAVFGLSRFSRTVATVTTDREVAHAFSIAARHARSGFHDSAWGVYIPYDEATRVTDRIVVFAGASYAARDASYDLTLSVSEAIAFTEVDFSGAAPDETNGHEIVFAKLTGTTTQYGSLTLEWYGASRVLTIGDNGIPVRQ